jgi:CRP-like cAMP-binding protein
MHMPTQSTASLYLAKLERRGVFSPASRAALLALPTRRLTYKAHQDIVREGERLPHCCFVESGLVSRHRVLRNGARQILSFHIRGDMVDLPAALVKFADHNITTHTATSIIAIDHDHIVQIAADYPDIGRAFWFDTLVDSAIFREWTVNVGRRTARERTAHLLLELAYKYKSAGMLTGDSFELYLSQTDLSDAVGVTPIHLNRTMQWLRSQGLIRTDRRTVTIENWSAMIELAGFTTAYLHPEGPRTMD